MILQVEKITDQEDLNFAFEIRRKVFVFEQNVDPIQEYDEFEETSFHFLAKVDHVPVGTARWRYTANGIKLERFAVLQEVRGKGVGQGLIEAVLTDINQHEESQSQLKYLHSQLSAVPLYLKFGFKKVGEIFEECNILHYKMVLN